MSDNNFLTEAGDLIDNAVFNAVATFAPDVEWDMEIIGEVKESIHQILAERGIADCYPWIDDNETICYATSDRCKHCKRGVI